VPAAIAGAIADANRPQASVALDARRKPAEMLTFSGVKPGDIVPGQGYITRLLARVVGPAGHVYAANLPTFNENLKTGVAPIVASPVYGNVSKIEQPFGQLRLSEPVDMVWTSENYHDFKNMGMFSTETSAIDRPTNSGLHTCWPAMLARPARLAEPATAARMQHPKTPSAIGSLRDRT
jgi:predicted methyltransferase